MSHTATFIKKQREFNGDARLYRLDPPLRGRERYNEDGDETDGPEHEYVLVSATTVPPTGAETYIFPATPEGEIAEWGELPGSYRGGLDHSEALSRAGYEVR